MIAHRDKITFQGKEFDSEDDFLMHLIEITLEPEQLEDFWYEYHYAILKSVQNRLQEVHLVATESRVQTLQAQLAYADILRELDEVA